MLAFTLIPVHDDNIDLDYEEVRVIILYSILTFPCAFLEIRSGSLWLQL